MVSYDTFSADAAEADACKILHDYMLDNVPAKMTDSSLHRFLSHSLPQGRVLVKVPSPAQISIF